MTEEIWKDIKGYEGHYQISNTGRVKSLDRYVASKNGSLRKEKEKIRKTHLDKYGYLYVILCKQGVSEKMLLHRLVAEAFLPNPNALPVVNHKNEKRDDNRVENLEWCTVQYNVRYSCSISIIQLSKDNKIIKIWDVISDAANYVKCCKGHIIKCCKKKPKYNTAGGYKWRYLDDYLADILEEIQDEDMEKEKGVA